MILKGLNSPVLTLEGQQIPLGEGQCLTIGEALKRALLEAEADNKELTGSERFDRWKLAGRIVEAGDELELSIEELAKVKLLVGKHWMPVVVGPVFMALEGAERQPQDPVMPSKDPKVLTRAARRRP